jgi:hypothetical protein
VIEIKNWGVWGMETLVDKQTRGHQLEELPFFYLTKGVHEFN